MGNVEVGVVSLKGAPLSLHTIVTAQFRFFDLGRAARCLLLFWWWEVYALGGAVWVPWG